MPISVRLRVSTQPKCCSEPSDIQLSTHVRAAVAEPAPRIARQAKRARNGVVAGLPWLVLHHPDMDWPWVLNQARMRNLQNRVGFILSLTRQVAVRLNKTRAARQLTAVQAAFEEARLAREDTFSTALTRAEQAWLRRERSEEARHWNVLTELSVNDVADG